jgi:hypothetical protein
MKICSTLGGVLSFLYESKTPIRLRDCVRHESSESNFRQHDGNELGSLEETRVFLRVTIVPRRAIDTIFAREEGNLDVVFQGYLW